MTSHDRDSSVVESRSRVRKESWVRSSAEAAGEVSSTVCSDSSFCFTPVLPQWYLKDPGHSVKRAGGSSHS